MAIWEGGRKPSGDPATTQRFVPTVPENFDITTPGNRPKLTWDASAPLERTVVSYEVWRRKGGLPWENIASGLTSTSFTDWDISTDCSLCPTWYYKIRATSGDGDLISDYTGSVSTKGKYSPGSPSRIAANSSSAPNEFSLMAYPNPFNPVITINYDLPENSSVTLKVYNLMGQEIRTLVNRNMDAGYQNVIWDGKDSIGNPVSSGMYIYRIDAISRESDKEFHMARKMVLLR